jgi:hypothetical protein
MAQYPLTGSPEGAFGGGECHLQEVEPTPGDVLADLSTPALR